METAYGTAWRRDDLVACDLPARRLPIGYVDTETTGLHGGTGTYVFAIAICRPMAAGLQVVQFFLPDPASESAFLAATAAALSSCETIASYNGRRFDLPLLATRWVMARMRADFQPPPHVDLLDLTRSLLRTRIGSCSLRAVEDRLLGFERDDDLPGWLVPEAYLSYVRGRGGGQLEAALRHNRQDVVSLHHLHQRLMVRLAGDDVDMRAGDWLSLGRHLLRQGRRADGWRALRNSAELLEDEHSITAAIELARRLTRRGAARSAQALLEWTAGRLPPHPHLILARARLLEWRLADLALALDLVERSLASGAGDRDFRRDLERRRARLRRRLNRRLDGQRQRLQLASGDRGAEDVHQVRVERSSGLRRDPLERLYR